MVNQLIQALVLAASLNADVPPNFVLAIAYAEHWNGSVATTVIRANAVSLPNADGSVDRGVMQLNSKVFEALQEWDDPRLNVDAGVAHVKALSWMCDTWWEVAVAYNCGLGRLRSEQGPPRQSLLYADRVMQVWRELDGAEYVPTVIYHR